ncbi:hypothetical protein [Sporosarcina jiandibaonis]|uniref:hypothetical protein n=1 Tax=Sporosarcina jiandibaonis TaxID=2715535 RepID=UPI00155585C6|nr:hypothetical protein [Sporosarcina jiandibaonis]
MIDKRKNVCYVIHIYYIRADEECKRKFISQHSADSRQFKAFMENYFKNVFPVSEKKMGGLDGEVFSQRTISWDDWQDDKEGVLEGITENEKCY